MTRIRFEDLPSTNTPRNAENLNKLNNVVISPTKPTTGEEVWIQKGKNLLSGIIEGYTLDGNGGVTAYNGAYVTKFIEIQPNTSYISGGFTNTYKEWYDENFSKINNTTDNPAISPSNAKYLRMNGTGSTDNLQIEEGTTATAYEPYISKKIHTKNNNGYYEEFYREIESGSNANGSYIKYSDGTLIQRGKIDKTKFLNTGSSLLTTVQGLNIYRSEVAEITLPQNFIDDAYSLTPQIKNGGVGARTAWIRTHDKENTYFGLQLTGLEDFTSSANGYTNLEYVDWIAIGRWK